MDVWDVYSLSFQRRRKRYIEEYQKINISNYQNSSENNEEDFYDDYYDDDEYYGADREEQVALREYITELYMDIDK